MMEIWARRMIRKAVTSAMHATKSRPSSHPFISGDTFRAGSRHIYRSGRPDLLANCRRGDTVFLESALIDDFRIRALDELRTEVVVISHNGDRAVGERDLAMVESPKILAWFAQNAMVRHDKLIPIPIGLENRYFFNNGRIGHFRSLRGNQPAKTRGILCSMNVATNPTERIPASRVGSQLVDAETQLYPDSTLYRESLARFLAVLSPPGNGFDCHRTWEALYLRTVPIVKAGSIFDTCPGLPVLTVTDWEELLSMDILAEISKKALLFDDPESTKYLWMPYWISLIEERGGSFG